MAELGRTSRWLRVTPYRMGAYRASGPTPKRATGRSWAFPPRVRRWWASPPGRGRRTRSRRAPGGRRDSQSDHRDWWRRLRSV